MSGGHEPLNGNSAGGSAGIPGPGVPEGGVYDWFRRGVRLLDERHPAAAVQLLERAALAEPQSRSIREALARAQFDTGAYAAALENFRAVAVADPSDDYAQFGWGVAAARLGDFESSAKHLALAVAMKPDNAHYRAALRQTRATLAARAGAFGPLQPGAPGYLAPPEEGPSGPSDRADGSGREGEPRAEGDGG
ncbi:tetratricopeptide repeat protein [Kitasatospora camelliae]|uniref:Tetratricopeptide repeat protein n=1 Tax=Kitasatospora camelliae TaxID=3156397 RepID=A0AAU8JZX8_9ACTN